MPRALFLVMVVGWTFSAAAQAPARKPRTLAGVCGTTNWVCVADCIDSACVSQCMRQGCEAALARLRTCTEKAGCAPDDAACAARTCGRTCQRAFEPAPPSPEKEKPQPCESLTVEGGGKVPEKLVGRWELSAATLKPEPEDEPARLDPQPRPDYARILEVTPAGCFLMRTKLEDATLGRGSALEVRSWGTFSLKEDDRVVVQTRDGQAVGQVCDKPRVIGLSKGRFQPSRYTYTVEGDTLTLVVDDASKRTFQFQRVKEGATKQ